MLCKFGVEIAFREIVRRLLPEEADAILAAGRKRHDREAERAYAFCAGIERRYFPIYEWEEIEGLVYCVPFQRMGWSYDDFHELDRSPGILLLRVLCAEPYEGNVGARVPLLEASKRSASRARCWNACRLMGSRRRNCTRLWT